jgi:hypothetical protein
MTSPQGVQKHLGPGMKEDPVGATIEDIRTFYEINREANIPKIKR